MDPIETARLAGLIEAFGADPARWPPEERRLAALADSVDLTEAREIDAILAHAATPSIDEAKRMAAMSRIMMAASGSKGGFCAAATTRLERLGTGRHCARRLLRIGHLSGIGRPRR